ncbi:MAG TPA: response regulator transcription factor [Thermoleophilaceae bacterium]|nr:response regulator transcription factor [Thermoleophilaceae bacterium]
MISVALAGADATLREQVKAVLAMTDTSLVAVADDAQTLVERIAGQPPAVVLVACDPMDENAPAEINVVRTNVPAVAVVVVAPSDRNRRARKALRHGAAGFVPANRLEETLDPTLRAVAAGLICLPQEDRDAAARQPLSYRERQVMGMVVMGFSNGEIARRLFLAESTVKSHLSSAFNKLGVRSRAEATAVVLDPAEGVGVGILTIPESAQSGSGDRNGGRIAF